MMKKFLNFILIFSALLSLKDIAYSSERSLAARRNIQLAQQAAQNIGTPLLEAIATHGIPSVAAAISEAQRQQAPQPASVPRQPAVSTSTRRPRSRSLGGTMPRSTTFSQFQSAPWMEALQRDLAERSAALSEENYPSYRPPRIAATDPLFLQAYEQAHLLGLHEPYFARAKQALHRGEEDFPAHYQEYMNPYLKEVIENLDYYGNRNFKENILPALEGQFIGLGQHGSKRHQELASRAARDVQEAILRQQQQALASGFHQSAKQFQEEKLRQLEAGRRQAELGRYAQAGNVADVETAARLGQARQAEQQTRLNENRAEFLRQQHYPHALLQQHAGILHNIPNQGITSQAEYTPPPPQTQVNLPGQLGATALGLYGLQQATHKKGGPVRMKPFGLSSVAFKSHNNPISKHKRPNLLRPRKI